MLYDESRAWWRFAQDVRTTSAGTTTRAARYAVEELEALALHADSPRIRRAAVAAIRTALSAPNAASRCAAMVALLNIRDWHGHQAAEV